MQQQPPAGYQAYPPNQQPNSDVASNEPEPESEAFVCPECGAELQDMDHRRKHAIGHWGDKPIANYHFTRLARERYAALMDQPVKGD